MHAINIQGSAAGSGKLFSGRAIKQIAMTPNIRPATRTTENVSSLSGIENPYVIRGISATVIDNTPAGTCGAA